MNTAVSGTAFTLASLRQDTSDQFKNLDNQEGERLNDLNDFVNLTSKAHSVITRIATVTIGGEATTPIATASTTL